MRQMRERQSKSASLRLPNPFHRVKIRVQVNNSRTDTMMTKRILVVDDEKKIVEIVKAYLEREGFKVSVAYDGKAALDLARRQPPDQIFALRA